MKKFGLFITCMVLFVISSRSQQLPLYSQYMLNDFLINPAIAGSKYYIPIRLVGRKQWMGMDNSPQTGAINAHGLLKNQHVGLGGMIYNDKFGPFTSTGLQFTYAYHLDVTTRTRIGFGISGSAYQYRLDERSLNLVNKDDPAVFNVMQTALVPDASFGLYYYFLDKFYLGFSAMQLLQLKIKLGDYKTQGLVRHYFAMAGFKFKVSDALYIEPSGLVKTTERTTFQIDGNLKFHYLDKYTVGVSYRHKDAIVAMIGFKYDNKYYFGYAFDYTLSMLGKYNSGSHEIVLGYNIIRRQDKRIL